MRRNKPPSTRRGHSFLGGKFNVDVLDLEVDVTKADIAQAAKAWGYNYKL